MQTTSVNTRDVARKAHVIRITRSRTRNRSQQPRVAPYAAVPKAASKWTVVVAFIFAVALHVGPVAWVELQQTKPTLEADAPVLIHSMWDVPETSTTGAPRAKSAAD